MLGGKIEINNMTQGVYIKTKEHRKKLSISVKKNLSNTIFKKGHKHSDEVKKKISQAGIGRVLSEETKQKMSKSKIGVKPSKESIERMKIAQKGHKVSAEQRKNFPLNGTNKKIF